MAGEPCESSCESRRAGALNLTWVPLDLLAAFSYMAGNRTLRDGLALAREFGQE